MESRRKPPDFSSPDAPGGLLQRVQIVKGWLGDDGTIHERVVVVAGNAANGADVDAATCTPRGPGADLLCATWRDPDWDAERSAVYYARVVENPSCRHDAWQCLALPAGERPSGCGDPRRAKTIQERAWSSPIWFDE